MNSQQTLVRNVTPLVASNPVARAVERANMKRWYTGVAVQILSQPDGSPADSLITAIAEALAIAIKTAESYDDPADVAGAMLTSMAHLVRMTEAGRVWESKHAAEIADALECAVQIICGAQPSEKLKAWAWTVNAARAA